MPNVEHRFCVRHLYKNYWTLFKGKEYNDFLLKSTPTGSFTEWNKTMKKLKGIEKEATYVWLMQ